MNEHHTTAPLAVVTGGSEGIGLAIADALAADGASLIVVARARDKLRAAAGELERHGTTVHTVSADLSGLDAPARIAAQAASLTDRVDTLVNAVGTAHLASPADTTLDAMNTPGAVRTPTCERSYLAPMTAEQRSAHDRQVERSYPVGHLGTAHDIAMAAPPTWPRPGGPPAPSSPSTAA
ncbi:SDR family NAD(P)-dependent oxidoreductase [Streptomyces sp. NPDC058459]|uniref:SDR family NAD(P)-dependent oxidoreductase n=1 Tax=Streptomyces sp. NPDC058459 TaxID=3346508 RepID=UPI00364BDA01